MKRTLLLIVSMFLMASCSQDRNGKAKNFFINPDLGDVNYRDFSFKNSSDTEVIFNQNIKDYDEDHKIIEYYFMTKDSVKYAGGKEIVGMDEVTFLEQYIYANNIKYIADTSVIKWNFIKEPEKEFTFVFYSDKSNYSFKTDVKANARVTSGKGSDTLSIEFNNYTEYLNLGMKYKELESVSTMTYVPGEGLVHFNNVSDKFNEAYFLIDSH